MIITLRNLQQQNFTIEIDADQTVLNLKEKIQAEKGGEYPVAGQKLIYNGKILLDEAKLADCDIEEKKFIVVMVTKPKTAPAASTTTPAAATTTASTPAAPAETTAATTQPTSTNTTPATPTGAAEATPPATGTPAATTAAPSADSSDFEASVQSIVAMGYERPQVEKALRASFNNADRAVEYLINGIPQDLSEELNPVAPLAGSGGGAGGGGQPALGGEDPLGFLRSQPQFEQMRNVVRENPNLLNAVLQQIGQTNPDLLRVISENQEEFVRLLNEDMTPPSSGGSSESRESVGSGGGGGGGGAGGGAFQIQVTPQDKEAIERLKSLGFPEHLVVQAYFACEKNENLAANFLLQNDFDD